MSDKVVGLHYGDIHPVHRAWFQEVGELKRLDIDREPGLKNILYYAEKAREVPDCDVILCEGGNAVRTAVVKKLFSHSTRIIRLIADQKFYECNEGKKSCREEALTHRFIDGAIANSEFMKEQAEEHLSCPIEVVEPFVPELEKYLSIEKTDYDTRNVLFIGYNYPNKNVKALVDAVSDLDVTLNIVGRGHPQYDQDNVITHGYVEDLTEMMKKCDLYVQPSDGEAFGVAPAEAMAASIPTIVTRSCGIKDIFEKSDSSLVVDSDADSIKNSIEQYYATKRQERADLGQKLRNSVENLHEGNSLKQFAAKLDMLIDKSGRV